MVDFAPFPLHIVISQVTPMRPLTLSASYAVPADEITTGHLATRHEIEWRVPETTMTLPF